MGYLKLLMLSTVAPVLVMPLAMAQSSSGKIEEITVTATKTGAVRVQRTALAVSAFTPATLTKSVAINVKDLVQYVPNLQVSQVTASAAIYIRGVGTNNIFNGSDPDVTVQVDGVYIARPSGQFADFSDIERIEVLRGPQGTLYGRNAIGGTINIVSKTPSDQFQGNEELTGGNYGLFQERGYVTGALIPGMLQASLAIDYIRHDDYEKDIVAGGNGIGGANHGGARAQLRYEPTQDITATTRFDITAINENVLSFSNLLKPNLYTPIADSIIGNYREVALSSPQTEYSRNYGVSEDIDYELNKYFSVESISAYRENDYSVQADADASELNAQLVHQEEHEHQLSQEVDLHGNYGPLKAFAGFYYFHEGDQTLTTSDNPATPLLPVTKSRFIKATPYTTADSYAGFAQGSYQVLPSLSFTAGFRYTAERKTLEQDYTAVSLNPATPGAPIAPYPFTGSFSRGFDAITPKFGVNWQVRNNVLLYFTATRGYKSGGVNYAAPNPLAASFAPETLWSYEVGAKTDLFDRRLRLNVTAFHYDYDNLQVQSLIGPGLVAIGNAASAKVNGLETEITARPIPHLLLTANVSALDAQYDQFSNASVAGAARPFEIGLPIYNPLTGTVNASNKRLNDAPPFSTQLAAEYDVDFATGAGAFGRVEFSYQSREYFDPSNIDVLGQGGYGLLNVDFGYTTPNGKWHAQIFGKNLTNRQYLITTGANGLEPAGLVGAPRTYGVRVSRDF